MKITISPKAKNWFIEELELKKGDGIRFFGKYGGATNVHTGFTTGMEVGSPSEHPMVKTTENDVVFFVEETDDWFFHGYDLSVDYDNQRDEPTYFYQENEKK